MTFRIDGSLKNEFEKLCNEFGLTATAAITIFIKTVVRERRIPFEIKADSVDETLVKGRKAFWELRRIAAENGTAGMTLEEINEEIRRARRGE